MVKKYIVTLSEGERQCLEQFTTTGKHTAYQMNHARILLEADQNQDDGSWCDVEIQAALDVSLRTTIAGASTVCGRGTLSSNSLSDLVLGANARCRESKKPI